MGIHLHENAEAGASVLVEEIGSRKFHFTASFIIFDSIIRFIGGNAITLPSRIPFVFIASIFHKMYAKCRTRTKKVNQPERVELKIKNLYFASAVIGVRAA